MDPEAVARLQREFTLGRYGASLGLHLGVAWGVLIWLLVLSRHLLSLPLMVAPSALLVLVAIPKRVVRLGAITFTLSWVLVFGGPIVVYLACYIVSGQGGD